MVNILHLTHKDVRREARIVKEVSAIAKAWGERAEVTCFGIGSTESETSEPLPDNVEIHSFSSRLLIFLFFIRALRLKPAFIHCHSVVVLPIGVLLKVFIKDAKLIYDVHELASDFGFVIRLVERKAWRYIDLFISTSFDIIRWYQREYGYGKQIALVMDNPPLKDPLKESKILGITDEAHWEKQAGNLILGYNRIKTKNE